MIVFSRLLAHARRIVGEWRNGRVNPILLLALLAAVAVVSAGAGVWLDRQDVPGRLVRRFEALMGPTTTQRAVWRNVSSHYHQLQVAEFQVSRALIEGGSLVEVGDNILIASPQGRLSYLDPELSLQPLGPDVPLNMEALRNDPLYEDPNIRLASLRTLDLLAIATGENSYDLYASHDSFGGECIQFVISRLSITSQGERITAEGDWSEVWRAARCLRFDEWGALLRYPPRSGGRMTPLTNDEILVSVGDYDHVGVPGRRPVSMDPSYDFGKLIAVNVRTGASRQFAIGLRNPQGLLVDRDGRIWETEHGPNGGDEINLIREGQNYGWPLATYGMDYTSPPTRWPDSPGVGVHEGYVRPRFAFLPSIGINNLVQPDLQAFPNWADCLLVLSLRGQSLFVARLDGDDIVYAEPIPLGHRLRDIAVLRNGRMAILTDGGTLLLVRNAETSAGAEQDFEVSGLQSLPPPLPEEGPQPEAGPVELGRAYFQAVCAGCHSVDGETSVGPPLNGIVGRDVASVEGYPYSDALRRVDGVWTEERLRAFIRRPESVAPGASMPQPDLRPQGPARIVDYLKTIRANSASNRRPAANP